MKTKAIKKVVEGKKVKKTATVSEIREAIAYWKGRLASLNEAGGDEIDDDIINPDDDEDSKGGDVDTKKFSLPDEDSVESKAKASPVGVFNPAKRFYRIHMRADKVVKEKLGKLLNKSKLGDLNSVIIENSAVDTDNGTFDMNATEMVVTIRVLVEKAKVQGFRKFMAVLKEEEIKNPEMIDEGKIWSAIFKGIADTAKGINKAAQEKIADANEKLKMQIGVTSMQEYFNAFFGKILANKLSPKNVFAGIDEEGTEAQFVYCASVKMKVK